MTDAPTHLVRIVGDLPAIARVQAVQAVGFRLRVVCEHTQVVGQTEEGVDAVGLVGSLPREGVRAVPEETSDAAPPEDVPLQPDHGEVGGLRSDALRFVGLDAHQTDVERPHLTGDTPSADDRDLLSAL